MALGRNVSHVDPSLYHAPRPTYSDLWYSHTPVARGSAILGNLDVDFHFPAAHLFSFLSLH